MSGRSVARKQNDDVAVSLRSALPGTVTPETDLIVAALTDFSVEAIKASGQAQRAVINDLESFGKGGDLIKAINAQVKAAETARRRYMTPFETAAKRISDLFKAAGGQFTDAKDTISAKMLAWQRAEDQRRREEAAAAEAARKAEAEALARAQAALGDEEGAEQIIADATEITVAPEKVVAQGSYGSTTGTRKTPKGEITDISAFLGWLAANAKYETEVLAGVSVGQRQLNGLAKRMLDAESPDPVPGFAYRWDEGLNVR